MIAALVLAAGLQASANPAPPVKIAAPPAPQVSTLAIPLIAAPAAVPPVQIAAADDANGLPLDQLDDIRGGEAEVVVLTEQNLNAVNSSTSQATTIGSGAIGIDANAFANFGGIGNFIINTGNQNTLQSSLSVSIVTTPVGSP